MPAMASRSARSSARRPLSSSDIGRFSWHDEKGCFLLDGVCNKQTLASPDAVRFENASPFCMVSKMIRRPPSRFLQELSVLQILMPRWQSASKPGQILRLAQAGEFGRQLGCEFELELDKASAHKRAEVVAPHKFLEWRV